MRRAKRDVASDRQSADLWSVINGGMSLSAISDQMGPALRTRALRVKARSIARCCTGPH